jgi:pseudouridylate synthase
MNDFLHLSTEIARALKDGRPVVALESALITHGLPFPANLETALAMEEAVRKTGSIPATVAILKGRITVGLSRAEIEHLASSPAGVVRKCSSRDFPIALARSENGATTVAGTLLIAHSAGIQVMATGGIGGVHRGHPFDISADLLELGRTPMAVVCSGAKSILDLPLTLEVLETQGVPIIGLGATSFPGFYTSETRLPVDATADSPLQAAKIIAAARRLGAARGLLIVVPVPKSDEMSPALLEAAISQAVAEAEAKGIRGKAVTPYLLSRISQISDGESQRANISLLVNNAFTAGQVAAALIHLQKLN